MSLEDALHHYLASFRLARPAFVAQRCDGKGAGRLPVGIFDPLCVPLETSVVMEKALEDCQGGEHVSTIPASSG